jgi:hypothetical protein
MTKINGWKCDICGKAFYKDDGGYSVTSSFEIEIPGSSTYDPGETFVFVDLCLDCKKKLTRLLGKFMDNTLDEKDLL